MKRLMTLALVLLMSGVILAPGEAGGGFETLFDGRTLNGWTLVGGAGPGYVVRDGMLVCPSDGGGNLFTNKQYSDFIFSFEFKLDKGGNNGVAIRSPLGGNPAYEAMECQILDDYDAQYANLEPGQYCASVYKVAPAKRGAVKPAGQWNSEQIQFVGRKVKITLNGKVVVDADLNKVTDPKTLMEHPGMLRMRGHIGFMGHGPSEVAFRNIRIKDLSRSEKDNKAPEGFKALFDGKSLKGWQGLVANPPERAMMAQKPVAAHAAADQSMREHWKVVDGVLTFDGKGDSLCTISQYADFEMWVDWKIEPKGDSGIYLRGTPQVQIWDDPIGSGGLYNNQKNPSRPIVAADRPVGFWNRFQILMVGERVHVLLNDRWVVLNTVMENYWERDKPIYPFEQIELQNHNNPLYFKNIYIREIGAGK